MTLVLRYAVRSDVGLLREGNEDSAYAGPRLLAVADGMGGHAAGEVASSLTIASMAKLDSEPPGGDMLAELAAAVAAANTRLQEMIIANPAVEGMGTTLTALFWSDGHAAVCHIGDSRGYLLREGELYQITHDHTLVQSLVDEGRISVDDVSTHPQRSLLLRALDGRSVAEPDLSVHDAQPGDRYLLCSDGLSGVVSDETLREAMATIEDPEAVTRQLIELALHGGGPDNITCIVADVVDTAASRVSPTGTPVLAGAAANVHDSRLSTDGTGPFGTDGDHQGNHYTGSYDEDGHPSMTVARPMVAVDDLDPDDIALALASENGTDMTAVRARRSHRAQPRRARRRRWPIVTTSLVVLLAVVIGGGYAAWRWSQDQYYVGADSKGQEVLIYRGVNQHIAGISLSHPYQQTGIKLTQVPPPYQQTVKATDAASNLSSAQAIVANIQSAVTTCQQGYLDRQAWVAREILQRLQGGRGAGQEAAQEAAGRRRRPRRRASPVRGHVPPVNRIRHRGRRPRPVHRGLVSSITAPSPAVDPTGPLPPASRSRRRTELIMLVFAFALVAFALANVGFTLKGGLPAGAALYLAVYLAIVLLAHLAVRRFAPWADPLLLPLAALLNGLSIVMMDRLAAQVNPARGVPAISASQANLQIAFSAVGIGCFVAVLVLIREPRVLQRYTYTLGAVGILLVALPALLPASISEVYGAKIQIRFGSFTTIQPEEFAKLALAASFAGYLVAKRDVLALAGRRVLGIDLPRARDLGPILLAWAASLLLLIFESDIGTSAVFMGLFVAMLYIATSRTSWLLLGFLMFVVGAFAASRLVGHVHERFDIWLHPFTPANVNGNSFQLVQGLYGMASGGLLGKGLGGGQPYITPLVQSDLVFTAFGEEIGLAGLMALLLIYGLIVQRGLRTAISVKDPFSKLLAGGLSFMLALQVFVIVGGVTRLIPLTGITTPFLSQGGSSLVGSWILIALLVRVSDTARRPPPRPIQEEGLTQVVTLN